MDLYGKVLFLLTLSYMLYRFTLFAGVKVYMHYVAQDVSKEYTGEMLMGDIGDALLKSNPLSSGRLAAFLVALAIVIAGIVMGESWFAIYGYAFTGFVVILGVRALRKRARVQVSQPEPAASAVSISNDAN
jgi:hypothetical protein